MPIYLFQCPTCNRTVEKIQAYSADPPTCPDTECAGHQADDPMERIPARPAQFQWGTGPKESNISAAIKRVRKVEGR